MRHLQFILPILLLVIPCTGAIITVDDVSPNSVEQKMEIRNCGQGQLHWEIDDIRSLCGNQPKNH